MKKVTMKNKSRAKISGKRISLMDAPFSSTIFRASVE